MPHREKPRVHGRDHEHGGADPQRIHYEDVGGSGDGGGGIQYDTDNEGGWLDIGTNDIVPGSLNGYGTRFHADNEDGSNWTVGIEAGGSGGDVVGLDVNAGNNDSSGEAVGIHVVAVGANTNRQHVVGVRASVPSGHGTGIHSVVSNGDGIYIDVVAGNCIFILGNGVPLMRIDAGTGDIYMRTAPIIGPF